MNDKKTKIKRVSTMSCVKKSPKHKNIAPIWGARLPDPESDEWDDSVNQLVEEYCNKTLQPGEEPDTLSLIGIPFEELGIPPAGWSFTPYDTDKYPLNQRGMSRLCVNWMDGKAFWEPAEKLWYIRENGTGILRPDHSGQYMDALCMKFEESMQYAAGMIQSVAFYKAFKKNCDNFFATDRALETVIKGARKRLSLSVNELDADHYTLATPTKVLELHRNDGTVVVRDMKKNDYITKSLGTEYIPYAECPNFRKMIDDMFCHDKQKIEFLQMAFGLSLCGYNEQKMILIFYGLSTNNGKSTLGYAIANVLGDYHCVGKDKVFNAKVTEGFNPTPCLAKMRGRRITWFREVSATCVVDASKLKALSGNDLISGRNLFKEDIEFFPQSTIIMDCNSLPAINDMSVFNRGSIVVFSCLKSFVGNEKDTSIAQKIDKERAGILNWMLEGWTKYCKAYPEKTGWTLPECIQKDVNFYRGEYDQIREFYDCKLEYTGDRSDRIETSAMIKLYTSWAKDVGVNPVSRQRLNEGLAGILNTDFPGSTVIQVSDFKVSSNGHIYYEGFRVRKRDLSDSSGFDTYLETEYVKIDPNRADIRMSLEEFIDHYYTWSNRYGIVDKLTPGAIIDRLRQSRGNIHIEFRDKKLVLKGIQMKTAEEIA